MRTSGGVGRGVAHPLGHGAVTVLLVAVGAAVGAPLRYLTDRTVQSRHDSLFPWGTFIVNADRCSSVCLPAVLQQAQYPAAPLRRLAPACAGR